VRLKLPLILAFVMSDPLKLIFLSSEHEHKRNAKKIKYKNLFIESFSKMTFHFIMLV
jgi:hypothetical protein